VTNRGTVGRGAYDWYFPRKSSALPTHHAANHAGRFPGQRYSGNVRYVGPAINNFALVSWASVACREAPDARGWEMTW
jgi:hypothetical protein